MNRLGTAAGLVLLGAGPRLLGAFCVVALIWFGFYWATNTPGAL